MSDCIIEYLDMLICLEGVLNFSVYSLYFYLEFGVSFRSDVFLSGVQLLVVVEYWRCRDFVEYFVWNVVFQLLIQQS